MEFIEIGIEEDFWVLELDTKNHGIKMYILGKGCILKRYFLFQ